MRRIREESTGAGENRKQKLLRMVYTEEIADA